MAPSKTITTKKNKQTNNQYTIPDLTQGIRTWAIWLTNLGGIQQIAAKLIAIEQQSKVTQMGHLQQGGGWGGN